VELVWRCWTYQGVRMDWDAASDEDLWHLVGQDADRAFETLFTRHATAVYNHCFRRTGSWSVAEDLVSIVFLRAWQMRRQVRFSGASALPWLLAVANNACRNFERSQRRHHRLLSRIPEPEEVADPSWVIDAKVDDERRMGPILVALRSLNAREQDVLTMCDWAGLSYADAAVALEIPVGTVRSRLSRARQRLRGAVGDSHASPEEAIRSKRKPVAADIGPGDLK
jgi:RNA polymerase sigma factor (sigma-70 family)